MKTFTRLAAFMLLILHVATASAQNLPGLSASGSGSTADETSASGGSDTAASDLDALLEVLQDETARQKLISALEAAQSETPQDETAGTEAAADEAATDESSEELLPGLATPDVQGFAQKAAVIMTDFANDLRDRGEALLSDVQLLMNAPLELSEARRDRIYDEAPRILATIVATVAIYRLLRLAARVLVRKPEKRTFRAVTRAVTLQTLLRATGLLLAWVAGYVLALAFGGGTIAVVQAFYLNAFLMVGAFTLVLSLFVANNSRDVALSRMPLSIDKTIFRSLKNVVGLLVFTMVAVVPIARVWTNFTTAAAMRSVLLTIALIMALVAIRRIRRAVEGWLTKVRAEEEARRNASRDEDDTNELVDYVTNTTETLWNAFWPPLATIYVLVCYWIAITRPYEMLDVLGQATAWTIAAIALFLLSLRLLTKAGTMALPMPSGESRSNGSGRPVSQLFVERTNGFLPTVAVVAGLVGILLAIGLELAAWDVISFDRVLSAERGWALATAALIVTVALMLWSAISAWIDHRLGATAPGLVVSARTRTLLSLARNALTIALVVLGGMMALSELGINIAPLIAGAGVIGLAIGFGAQKLVQDIITGVFIQLENAINEGDVVTVAGISGAVESLTIRSVGIRDLAGVYHLVPFSAVDTVSNFMRRFSFHVEEAGISYDSDIDAARDAMFEAFNIVRDGPFGHLILGDLEMHGVTSLGDSAVVIRARIKTLPGRQWEVGRAYTEQMKKVFDERGIEIPFPHREVKLPAVLMDKLQAMAEREPVVVSGTASPVHAPEPRPLGAEAGPAAGPVPDDGPD